MQLLDEALASRGLGAAEQLAGLFPGQLEPVQGGADRLAATTHPKPLAHQPSQTPQGPAWLGIGAGYGRSSRLLLCIAYGLAKGGLELRAKGGAATAALIAQRRGTMRVVDV